MLRSAVPLKTAYGNSQILLITDDKRLLSAVTAYSGKSIAVDYKWRTYKGELEIIRQSDSDDRFEFTARAKYAARRSTLANIQFYNATTGIQQDRLVTCDFSTNSSEHQLIDNQETFVLINDENIVLRKLYRRISPDASEYRSVWSIEEQCGKIITTYIEPVELMYESSIFLPSVGNRPAKFVYFHEFDSRLNVITIVRLGQSENGEKPTDYTCLPDPIFGFPDARCIFDIYANNRKSPQQSVYVKDGRFYCLEWNRNCEVFALWCLDFDDEPEFRWSRLAFAKPIPLLLHPFKLIVNDEGEVLIVRMKRQEDMMYEKRPNDVIVTLCRRLKVPSLKHLASRIVIDSNPGLIKMTEAEQRRHGIPHGCVPSCPWMNNFSKPMNTEP